LKRVVVFSHEALLQLILYVHLSTMLFGTGGNKDIYTFSPRESLWFYESHSFVRC